MAYGLVVLLTFVCLIATVMSQIENLEYRRMFHPLYRRRMQMYNNNPAVFDSDNPVPNGNIGQYNNNQRQFHRNQGPFNNNRGPQRNFGRRRHPLNRRPPSSGSNPLHDMDFADILRILLLRLQLGFRDIPTFSPISNYHMYDPMDPDTPDVPDAPQQGGRGQGRQRWT